jgi:tetratricopeptide (TPR) repeat protein
LLLSLFPIAQASLSFDTARGLFEQNHFPEAETALREVIKGEPTNAAAYHYLARTIIARMTKEKPTKEEAEARIKEVVQWITRATELEPNNAAYLRDFGMSQIAGVTSLKKGRKILEQALALDPKDVDTHEFLALLYSAPWIMGGDKDKAKEHRRALQQLDPARGALAEIDYLIWNEKDFPAAFTLAESLLKKDPDSALGHYLYGYVAAESKTNLERGLASLKKGLELPRVESIGNSAYSQPMKTTPSFFWHQIGKIERELGHLDAARTAFTTAVTLDPGNHWAATDLAKLKS